MVTAIVSEPESRELASGRGAGVVEQVIAKHLLLRPQKRKRKMRRKAVFFFLLSY